MNKVILQIVSCLVSCIMMVGCSDEIFNNESREGTGYLSIALGRVNVELSSISRAEAGTLPAELIPQEEDFEIDIQKDGISVDGFPKPYIEITDNIELTAGSYTVIAYSGENNDIQDKPYFSGSSSIQIYPGKSTEVNINTALGNAMLTPSVSESLQKHYSEWTLTLKVGEVSMKLADNANTGGYLFVKSGQSVNAVLEGKNILEKETSHEWEVVSSASACTKYVIQCDPDIPIFSFGLNAVAEHTTDISGNLNGTKVFLTFGDLSSVPISLISDLNVTLVNDNGEVVRSYTTNNFNSAGDMSVENNWTYLPQGEYALKYSYTIDGETVSDEKTKSIPILMPLPTFDVEVSAQTSYSVYLSEGAAAANETNGSSIFDITTTTTISPEILNNERYADLFSVTYSLDSGESTTIETKFENIQWGKRRLTAFVVFDGSTFVSYKDCEVTGIPYYIDFNGNANPENWVLNNNGKTQNRLTLKRGDAFALSPKYYIPSELEVAVGLSAYAYGGSIYSSYKPTVSIHASEIGQNSTVITTLAGSNLYPDNADFREISTVLKLTDDISKICIYTQGKGSGLSTGLQYDMGVVCGNFYVNFK